MHTHETTDVEIDQEDADDIARQIQREDDERLEGAACVLLIVGALSGAGLLALIQHAFGWCGWCG